MVHERLCQAIYKNAAYETAVRTILSVPPYEINPAVPDRKYLERTNKVNSHRVALKMALETIPDISYPHHLLGFDYPQELLLPFYPGNPNLQAFLAGSIDHFAYQQKFQYLLTELARGNVRVAIEGPRASGKDTTMEILDYILGKWNKLVIQSKLSGFVRTAKEKDRFLGGLSRSQRAEFQPEFLMQSIRESKNPMAFYREFIDEFIDYYMKKYHKFPDEAAIKARAVQFADEMAKTNANPGVKGETSWHLLQKIYIALLNTYYVPETGKKSGYIHISNGGHITRDFMYHRYNPAKVGSSPYALNLLPFLGKSTQYDIGVMLGVNSIDDFTVPLPMPTVTYYLSADEKVLKDRILRDGNKHPDGVEERLDALKNKPYLDKLAGAFQRMHPQAVKIIDANRTPVWVADDIIADMEEMGMLVY